MPEPKLPADIELGPIRPPSEAQSLLVRVTRNCPWNHCTFCNVYKRHTFSRRRVEEVKAEIDLLAQARETILSQAEGVGSSGRIPPELGWKYQGGMNSQAYAMMARWLSGGTGSVFLQDGNSLQLPTSDLVSVLRHLKQTIPGIRRITSYARSSTVAKKSVEELTEIREAGLDRLHIGMESGSDKVLKRIKKGATGDIHIKAGRQALQAGMELSEYLMPGVGMEDLSDDHALESARVLNAINPHFIRLRTFTPIRHSPLLAQIEAAEFTPLSEDGTVREIRLFIKNLNGIRSQVVSDHMMNLLMELNGQLPDDQELLLETLDAYLSLDDHTRQVFRIGRRAGIFNELSELEHDRLVTEATRLVRALKERYGDADLGLREEMKGRML